MIIAARVGLALALMWVGARGVGAAGSPEPWIGAPAFSIAPDELLAGLARLPAPDASAEVLLEETRLTFDESSRVERTYHAIYRVLNAAGVEDRSHYSIEWSPWRQARPIVRARIISADGVTHELDPSTIADAPTGGDGDEVYSDRRAVEGPLPAVAPGSIVEIVWTLSDTASSPNLGNGGRWVIGDNVPVRHTVFQMSAPASLPLVYRGYNLGALTPARDERDGRVSITLEAGPQPKLPDVDVLAPYDVHQLPTVAWSTAGTWSRVATEYASVVDRQIASAKVGSAVGSALRGVDGRLPRLEAVVRELHRQIRYTGIEFGESSIVPARPDETLKRRFGDCKDKSTLLVAMLRVAGFDAHVALLDTGFGPDPDVDLPGIDTFDHAIVFVGGEPPVWIDATAQYLRVGDLPATVAGRLALVASGSATTLQRIPETPASRHRVEHAHDYFLVERGRGRVVETISPEGGFEGDYRERYAAMDDGDVKKRLDEYVKRVFKARALGAIRRTAATDFSETFVLSCEGKETEVGESFADASTVRFPPADFVDRLEDELPRKKKSDAGVDGEAKTADRTHPFRLREAFVDVWTTRVHPPPGFVPGEAPQVEDTHVGPLHYTRTYEAAPDGTIVFRATLDTGDRLVWTPQELADVRAWVTKIKSAEAVQLVFEQTGYKALRAGKLQEAVHEYRELAKLHPAEALHHSQLAEAYVSGGLGEAAREEAREGIKLDPRSADAWRTYGWAHLNDLVGRTFMKGSDLAEAEKAYRKATELDPKDQAARKNLAILLEHDPRTMERYGPGARLSEAIDVWRARRKDLDANDGDASLLVTLARAERWTELRDFAREARGAETHSAWIVVATAVLDGIDDALAEAGRQTTSRAARDKLLSSAGATLLQLRHYREASALVRAGAQSASQGAAAATAQADMVGRCQRHEELSMGGDTPEDLLRRFFLDLLLSDDVDRLAGYMAAPPLPAEDRSAAVGAIKGQLQSVRSAAAGAGLTFDGIADIVFAMVEWRTEGSETTGYKTSMKMSSPGDTRSVDFFLRRVSGALKIAAVGDGVHAMGPVALAYLEAGDTEAARTWLTWALDQLPTAKADLLEDLPFVAFWPPDPQEGDAGLRLAAAALAAGGPAEASQGLALLEQARGSATGERAIRLDHALATAYVSLRRIVDAIEPARRLYEARPTSDVAFGRLAAGLMATLRFDELNALCDARALKTPDDEHVWRTRSRAASLQRRWDDAARFRRRLVELGKANAQDYNELAWESLFRPERGPQMVNDAERAALFQKSPPWSVLHTLAAVYADAGRVVEARQTLVNELVAAGREEPGEKEWLVIGRLAQQFGDDEHARAAYGRVGKPKDAIDQIGSSYELAQVWMAGLAPAKSAPTTKAANRKARGASK